MDHNKRCLAAALICAIENLRDYEHMTNTDFRLSASTNEFLVLAEDYLETGLTTCKCGGTK